MDRRRYVPNIDGAALETRQLMAASSANSLLNVFGQSNNSTAASNLAVNLTQRLHRIKALPFFMHTFETTRALPESIVKPIQDDLIATISELHDPTPSVLNQFNRTIRLIDPTKHFSKTDATELINNFDSILVSAGMQLPLRAKYVEDMTALAQLDAGGPEPTIQLTNDFSTVAQLVTAMGQPFAAPDAPTLAPSEKVDGKYDVTTNHQPTFVGLTGSDISLVVVNIANGGVIATGNIVSGQTRYSLKSDYVLPDGVYKVALITVNPPFLSIPSHVYKFRVYTPKGPKAT
jgi:hypothetical protein